MTSEHIINILLNIMLKIQFIILFYIFFSGKCILLLFFPSWPWLFVLFREWLSILLEKKNFFAQKNDDSFFMAK